MDAESAGKLKGDVGIDQDRKLGTFSFYLWSLRMPTSKIPNKTLLVVEV